MRHIARLTRLERAQLRNSAQNDLVYVFQDTRDVVAAYRAKHGHPHTLADVHELVRMTYATPNQIDGA